MTKFILALAGAAAFASGASAATPVHEPEARIPFVQYNGIRDFRPDGRDIVYLQDRHRRWYRATLLGPCFDLPFAHTIGVDTGGMSTLDRFGTLIVSGDRCPLQSLVRVEGPPAKQRERGERA